MELTREWVAAVTGGQLGGRVNGDEPVGDGVAFDTRRLRTGEVFVALPGARDGHEFVGDAFAAGAAFAMTTRSVGDAPVVIVADVSDALLALAGAARDRLAVRTVGITGSVGKTSTKDLTAAALGAGFRTHAAPESFNNEIGVPVTLLGAPDDSEALVVEMGARFAGNIAQLCELAHPEIGIITNIGITHAEFLGGPEGVAEVKGELLDALPVDGLAVIPSGSDPSGAQRHRSAAPVVTVGREATADVRVSAIQVDDALRPSFRMETPWGHAAVGLELRGGHHAFNAAKAAAAALHLGVPMAAVVDGLSTAAPSGSRMQLIDTPGGIQVLNDAYNASPVSVLAALDAFGQLRPPGRRIAVLGEMRELGARSVEEHARVGAAVATGGVSLLVAVGDGAEPLAHAASSAVEVLRVADAAEAAAVVGALVRPGDAVLVKASRAVGLEAVVAALTGEVAA